MNCKMASVVEGDFGVLRGLRHDVLPFVCREWDSLQNLVMPRFVSRVLVGVGETVIQILIHLFNETSLRC